MQDFPGNSERAKRAPQPEVPKPDTRPKVERVTSAEIRKPGLGRKFKETFVLGSTRDAADYMITDVIVPAIKDTIVDALQGGIERLFNGDSHRPRRSTAPSAYSTYAAVPRVNYQSITRPTPATSQPGRMLSRRSRSLHDFGEIVIDSRAEAQQVLEDLYEYLSRFGVVHISDLYDMVDIQSSHVDTKWGWTSLQGSKLRRASGGRFVLDLPEPEQVA